MKNDGRGNYKLTPREAQVLAMILEGAKYELIAERLSMSMSTVSRYVQSFFAVCEVHSRAALCEFLLRLERGNKAA